VKEELSLASQVAAGFHGLDGWERDPVIKTSRANPTAKDMIFCPSESKLSITGWADRRPVAISNVNYLSDHLESFPGRIANTFMQHGDNEGTVKFVRLQLAICKFEQTSLVDKIKEQGLCVKEVARRNGLIVMTYYQKRGFATKMVQESDKHLQEQGMKAVVVFSSSKDSHGIFLKAGYTSYIIFPLSNYNIDSDDYGSYMIKVF